MDYSEKITCNMYFATITVVDWIDVFTRPIYKDIIVSSLNFCIANKGLVVYGWVIMTNHIHLLIGCDDDHSITNIIRDFKTYTSRQIHKAIEDNIQESRKDWMLNRFTFASLYDSKHQGFVFWQDGNHLLEITTKEFYLQKLNYIHQNPVKQGFVKNAEDYVYSSAFAFGTSEALIEISRY